MHPSLPEAQGFMIKVPCAFIQWFKVEQSFHAFRSTGSSPVQHTEMLGILLNFLPFANLIEIIKYFVLLAESAEFAA